ncbi:alpha/beta hydrolase [Gammaproteobacteria bacterium 45_16_T64]|nr:alpha/beta hydrolase [Gammaproteobacteria bacterium 45_16_T64]
MAVLVKDRELQYWQQKGEFANLNGHSIFYIDEGSQELPAILLIHGFPTSSWDWEPIWEGLRQEYRVVCLDMLGFGFSDKPNHRNYSIHKQADVVESLVKSLKLNEFFVLAHDYGDTVAQELLARQNEGSGVGQWLSCCFLNGGLFPETHRALITQKILLSPLGAFANKLAGRAQFDKSFSKVFATDTKPTDKALSQFWELINANNGKHIFHNLITYMNDRIEHRERWVSALQKSIVPLALINGSVDPISGKHMVARYKELNCRLDYISELEQVGHYPQVEAPKDVLDHFLTFITQPRPTALESKY